MRHGEFVAAQTGAEFLRLQRIAQPLGNALEHGVAGALAILIVDVLEAVEVDRHQRDLAAHDRGVLDQPFQMGAEIVAVGQRGQRVVQRHRPHPFIGVGANVPIDQIGHDTGADDQQRHAENGQRQRLHRLFVARRRLHPQRHYLQRRHAGEMQADDRRRQAGEGARALSARRQMQTRRAEADGDDERGDQRWHAPRDQTFDPIGQHAAIVHCRDRRPEQRAAPHRLATPTPPHRHDERDESADRGDQHGSDGQDRIEADRRAGLVGENGDEVGAPDRRARRGRREDLPAQPLMASRLHRALDQAEQHPATEHAYPGRGRHEPEVMAKRDAGFDHRHESSPIGEAFRRVSIWAGRSFGAIIILCLDALSKRAINIPAGKRTPRTRCPCC